MVKRLALCITVTNINTVDKDNFPTLLAGGVKQHPTA